MSWKIRGAEMFEKHRTEGYRQAVAGIEQKTLAHGAQTLMVEFRLQKAATLPLHISKKTRISKVQ